MTDLYLYQTVHVTRGRALHVARHAAVLDAAARAWFGYPYPRRTAPRSGILPGRSATADPDAGSPNERSGIPRTPIEALKKRIEALARAEQFPEGVSGFVRIELLPEGEERLVAAGISLYDGYGYRSIQPAAITVCYDIPFTEAPTSVHETAMLMARRIAVRAGAGAAIRCDGDGILREAEGAPIFAIAGRTVLAPPDTDPVERVERMITRRAVEAAGLEFREEAFGRNDLKLLDELFFTDHRGITSLSHCDGLPLMIYTAERIAAELPLTDE